MKPEAAVRECLIEIEIRKYTPKTRKGYRTSLNLYLRFYTEELGITDMENVALGARRLFKLQSGKAWEVRCRVRQLTPQTDAEMGRSLFQISCMNFRCGQAHMVDAASGGKKYQKNTRTY